ncbi:polyphosphate kinase 1 [Flavobacterium sp. DG1-102-2]|uniref:polyphosphate kinase 1 n=1 Tax=Flavobacterium sp. DG1-102-2 TaxID=3081663 RepID=UPI00294917F9|nr:polyphosphate kinase 1 [Flavobacterium sp. DG1-102-2]MDV6168184.1 polyphosphate kinase 1 [Flavobacterium sp. DG1-102-2]
MSQHNTSILPATVHYNDRDISWLSFNERVLLEAADKGVPLLEKIKFLSIYSSNLDEFYRVRVPALMALKKLTGKKEERHKSGYKRILHQISSTVFKQQQIFGDIFKGEILPGLASENIELVYDRPIPDEVSAEAENYFFTRILTYVKCMGLNEDTDFFTENNKLYFLVSLSDDNGHEYLHIVNIPSEEMPRFFSTKIDAKQYILFIDDIIKEHLDAVFMGYTINGAYSFKITRDAAIEFDDDYEEGLAAQMEKKIAKRDFGIATRFLYDDKMPAEYLDVLIGILKLKGANVIMGGSYHNLKDLAEIPVHKDSLEYKKWPAIPFTFQGKSLLDHVQQQDIMIHTPYESYDTVLRFFNEAAIHPEAEEVYVTVYRMAQDSRIANALISAARNGKKVTVIVELKARFDESNNIRWSKKLSDAGVTIIHSVPSLKIHAKIALVKFRKGYNVKALGLLATGNLNETTARFYTDHILLTAHEGIMTELKQVFKFLSLMKKPDDEDKYDYKHLLVAQFNLRDGFLALIDREIANAAKGLPAQIIIKLNNLEEKVLIDKLYEASAAGVKIDLIVRGICCLIPGIAGLSENVTVKRIIDRYLEHGRIFVFHNIGIKEVYLGSADWMNRNIYRRVEVCFPIYDETIKSEMLKLIEIQLETEDHKRAQQKIYELLSDKKEV